MMLTSGTRSTQARRSSPGTILARTRPRARTDAQRTAALAKAAISPTNCPSRRTATKNSRWPRCSPEMTLLARDAPCAGNMQQSQAASYGDVMRSASTCIVAQLRKVRWLNSAQACHRGQAKTAGACADVSSGTHRERQTTTGVTHVACCAEAMERQVTSSRVGGSSSPMTSGTWEACCSPSESWEPRMPDPELEVLHGTRITSLQQ